MYISAVKTLIIQNKFIEVSRKTFMHNYHKTIFESPLTFQWQESHSFWCAPIKNIHTSSLTYKIFMFQFFVGLVAKQSFFEF